MGDDKVKYEALPIPTYEEAISSRPTSSRSHLGPEEISDDAERQGLLRHGDTSSAAPRARHNGYQPPTVTSARSSLDYLGSSAPNSARQSLEQLTREIHEMDIDDTGQGSSRRSRLHLRSHLSKRFNDLTRTLSAIHRPLTKYLPKFRLSINLGDRDSPLRRHGTILLLRLFALLLVVALVYVFFVSDLFSMRGRLGMGQSYNPQSVENFVQSEVNKTRIAENLEKLTKFPHLAGTEGSFVLAKWIEREFKHAGFDEVGMEEFQVYLNYPTQDGRRIAIVDPPELAWQAKLEEDHEQTPVFHGHSRSGNVTGHLVYANYGSREDFKALADHGVSLEGAIALVRYYGTETDRALKVKAAELAGAAGCIIYSDPSEDGFVRGPTYPDGRYMPADGVQRGAVSLMSWVVGDVLTPGFASTPQQRVRLRLEDSAGMNKIPSLPIAWRDAQRLLQVLKGHGFEVPSDWVGGVPEVDKWWSGDVKSPKVNLMNLQDEVERQPIYNVLGRIIGLEQPEKKIIVGNHRDSWCSGSADPGSGTAVFLEVVRVFGELLTYGWRPLRTIEFASWDGEEYNLIGSTEHVESRLDALRANAYAYINVDVGVSGTEFRAAGSPVFERIVSQLLGRVTDPFLNQTLKDIWKDKGTALGGLGAGSDYVAFQDITGTSSVDFGFGGDAFPYHSCYENFEWMTKYGDPTFEYHKMLGQFWGLLLLAVADSPILPFDLENYANAVTKYVADLEGYAKSLDVPMQQATSSSRTVAQRSIVDFSSLFNATAELRTNTQRFSTWAQSWHEALLTTGGFENNIMGMERLEYNSRMALLETHLLDLEVGGGIPNRTQFKHVIFGPQIWSGYDEAYFPAIRDCIDSGDWDATQFYIDRVAGIISEASRRLIE